MAVETIFNVLKNRFIVKYLKNIVILILFFILQLKVVESLLKEVNILHKANRSKFNNSFLTREAFFNLKDLLNYIFIRDSI